MAKARYSIYLLYLCKGTNTDAEGAARLAEQEAARERAAIRELAAAAGEGEHVAVVKERVSARPFNGDELERLLRVDFAGMRSKAAVKQQ